MNDAERATARELFRQGDELQRGSRFAEALEKFERAQEVYAAPTNELRIAECQAALGHLVESAEAFRAVVRSPIGPATPPAFRAAGDQARAELEQVEPRVPKLVLKVQPARIAHIALRIDGQSAPAALIGEPIPLDPGAHKVTLTAPEFERADESFVLSERETRVVSVTLKAAPMATLPAPAASSPPPTYPPPPVYPLPAYPPAPASGQSSAMLPPAPPVVVVERAPPSRSRTALLLGAHLGVEGLGGELPLAGGSVPASEIAGAALAYGLDAGFRFARHWYLGLTLEHANFSAGTRDVSPLQPPSDPSTNATLLGAVLGVVVNPDRPSFYGEIGAGGRWFSYGTTSKSPTYNSGELSLGAGAWIPIGRSVRLLPKAVLGVGSFDEMTPTGAIHPGHVFLLFGVTAFYDLDL